MFTWAKYRDEWGVRGPQAEMTPGRVVDVVRKDGKRAAVEIGQIVARFSADGMAIATVRQVKAPAPGTKATKAPRTATKVEAPPAQPKVCRFCGEDLNHTTLPSKTPDLCGCCDPLDFGTGR